MTSTPYYDADGVTLYQGNALDVLQTLPSESVDIVVTSPPYNMGLTPGGNGRGLYRHPTQKAGRFDAGYDEQGDDALDPEEYAALRVAELWEMWRVARMAVFYNHRPRIIHGVLHDPLDVARYGLELPPLRQRIILARATGIDVSLNHFCTRGEYLLLFAKPSFRLVSHAASGMGDVWPVDIIGDSEHPAPFDPAIPSRCIDATGAISVLDPFAGSGTTLRVAGDAGLAAIGIERSRRWCDATVDRLAQGSLFGNPS